LSTTTFADNRALPVHRWFRFPAGYSGAWAGAYLTALERPAARSTVLDPFAGCGTTLVAAQEAGWPSLGIEAHPFMARVARAKLGWVGPADALREQGSAVVGAARPIRRAEEPSLLTRCFEPGTLAELRGLQVAIAERGDELLWLALVAILRACSHAGTAPWQYVLPARRKGRVASPSVAFLAQVSAMAEDMAARQRGSLPPPAAEVVDGDARTCDGVPDGCVDAVVTSPPYANNFDYADAARLEMSFLGGVDGWGDLSALRRSLTRSCSQQVGGLDAGALLEDPSLAPIRAEVVAVHDALRAERDRRAGRKSYHLMVPAYFVDMAATWRALRRVCRPGATVCLVIGDSAPYGVHVPVERWLGELAVAAGFSSWSFEKVRDRNVKWRNRKHRVPLHEGRLTVR
jgi:hypothetical protein